MSGFSAVDRAVLAWTTVLCVSPAVSREHGRALVELCKLEAEIDRMDTGVMQPLNTAVMELAQSWKPGEPIPFRCIDYCRLALAGFPHEPPAGGKGSLTCRR